MDHLMPVEIIENKIYLIRGYKVMLDRDLAGLYGVKTKVLNQAVKRNLTRFPGDFMFQLDLEEARKIIVITAKNSRSQSVTLKQGQNIKYLPYVFTEQGIAMLSSVLKSERAIQVNILIMRIFVKIRNFLASQKEIKQELLWLNKKTLQHDVEIDKIFDVIKKIIAFEEKPKKKIGFLADRHQT